MINDEIIFVYYRNRDNIRYKMTYCTIHHYTTGRVEYNTYTVFFVSFVSGSLFGIWSTSKYNISTAEYLATLTLLRVRRSRTTKFARDPFVNFDFGRLRRHPGAGRPAGFRRAKSLAPDCLIWKPRLLHIIIMYIIYTYYYYILYIPTRCANDSHGV